MIEVLVTMVIVSIGLLGFAKMQAAVLSSTQAARVRSLVALQVNSLASAMYGNRSYWSSDAAPAGFTSASGSVEDASGVLTAAVDCRAANCTPAQMAAYDVQTWAGNLQAHFPTYAAVVACDPPGASPARCSIDVTWDETTVAMNRSVVAESSAMTARRQFTLLVEP